MCLTSSRDSPNGGMHGRAGNKTRGQNADHDRGARRGHHGHGPGRCDAGRGPGRCHGDTSRPRGHGRRGQVRVAGLPGEQRSAPGRTSPARQRFIPWGRATTAGARAMSPQSRLAAAANSLGFTGAVLTAVSCTGRSQCTSPGAASTRRGRRTPGRWSAPTHPAAGSPRPRHLRRWRHFEAACPAWPPPGADDGFSGSAESATCWAKAGTAAPGAPSRTRPWSSPPSRPTSRAGGAGDRQGRAAVRHDPGRALERAEVVRRDHQARRRAERVACPATGNCTAVGTNSGGKALAAHWERQGLVGPDHGQPGATQPAERRVLPGEGLHRGRHGRLADEHLS